MQAGRASARQSFSLMQVPAELRRPGRCAEYTIRTHVTSRMCASSPDRHGTTYDDFGRLDRSRYRLQLHLAATGLTTKASGLTRRLTAGHSTTVTRRNHRTAGPDAGSPNLCEVNDLIVRYRSRTDRPYMDDLNMSWRVR